MKYSYRLFLIKLLHTAIWAVMVAIIGYIWWSAVTGIITFYSWAGVFAVVAEGLILLLFGGKCPLTIWARKYSSSTEDNFDIFLPVWLARYNKLIFTIIFLAGVMFLLFRY